MPRQRFDYSSERQRHEKLVGRAELLARLDQLLVDGDGDHWVVVTGGPGMGKSAILAAWLARREVAGATVPHHFIRRGQYDWDDPAQLVGSLVAQLEDRFAALREPEADARMHPAARLARMLSRVSEHELVPRRERLVVLIDGLDEYDPSEKAPLGDPLTAFLPHALPVGVSVLCASRPRHPYVASLAARDGEFVQIDLDDPASAADNEATVRAFWERAAGPLGLDPRDREDARFLNEAVARAGGNVQHAVQLRKQLAALGSEQRRAARHRIDEIPRGLEAQIAQMWERIAVDPIVADGLGILCAAREALSLDELGAVAGWTGPAKRQIFARGAMELLVETQRPDGTREYRLHHDSIRAHIARAIGSAALSEHHRSVARQLANWPCPSDASSRRYALRHAVIHRAEAGDRADAWRLAVDVSFLEARCRELGVGEAEADVTRLAARCRASGEEVLGLRADDLSRALARESHWLRAAPEATAALIWNRLRRLGWSASDLDEQLRVPEGANFLRARHVHTRDSAALVRDLVGHTASVNACAVTPDGQRVVSASLDMTLKVWEMATGRGLATLEGHTHQVWACAVTPDGRHVVSASLDTTLKVWEMATGRALATLEGHTHQVWACAVTPDGQHVVSASLDTTLKVWELATWRTLATLKGHTGGVTACAVTPDGRRVVSASWDKTLKVWDLATGRALATLEGHTHAVTACSVTPDGVRMVSASRDGTLKVWDLATERVLATLQSHTDVVTACAVTSDGRRVVSASEDKKLKIWDLETGCAVATLQGHTDMIWACAVTPDGQRVVSASKDKTLKVWNLTTEHALATPHGHADRVTACAVAPDGRCVVSASWDETLKVWAPETGRTLVTLEGHTDRMTACAVTPDGRRMVSASRDGTLKVWAPETGCTLATLKGHTNWVNACTVTPDGRRVVSASGDRTLRVWEVATRRALVILEDTEYVNACAVTPDGRLMVSASDDRTLKIWDLETRRALATLEGHTNWVNACAVTPDGRGVVSASSDKTLILWELATGHVLATLEGHTNEVTACAVTPDSRYVISASGDQTLKVWDLESHACLVTHRGDAPYLAVGATSTVIVAGDSAGGVWFLDLPQSHRTTRPLELRATADAFNAEEPDGALSQQSTRRSTSAPPCPPRSAGEATDPRNHKDMEHPVMKNPAVREGTEFPAAVVFVLIKGLKDCSDAPMVPNALRALNDELHGVDASAFVLSTIAGAIVVVPDTASWSLDTLLDALGQAKIGFALRVGVTHGTVESVKDIDDAPNLIGPPINIAARLATSADNPGVLVHESYAGFIDGTLGAGHWLHRSVRTPITIAGKPQDPPFVCFRGRHALEAKLLERQDSYSPRAAVLIAYDLPKFSAGDRAQLRKRFTRLAQVFQKLRQSATLQATTALLSPGGDGGVLVLDGVSLSDAAMVASRLQELSEIESLDHSEAIAVEIRIGVHYGQVMHHMNARGIERPTGLDLFAADDIVGDEHARSRKGIILTRLIADSLAGGSGQRLATEFEPLPRLTTGPASDLERFVKANSMRAQSEGRAAVAQQVKEMRMTRDELLTRLSRLLPSQFKEVLFRAKVPSEHLPGESAPQTTRAVDTIQYLEQHNQLEQLARILDEIATGPR